LLCASLLTGCFLPGATASKNYFQLPDGQFYGPVLVAPITIRLGQSVNRATGSVGPQDRDEGSAAIWEGHALSIEPDRERNRSVFFFVEGEDLVRVSLQVNDQEPIVEENPGAYLSGEFSMVRWAQDYTLQVSAEDRVGLIANAAIHVSGEDARIEGADQELPLRVRLLRQGRTEVRDVRGIGFFGKLFTHRWPTCGSDCDLASPGGALVALVSGPADTLALILDERIPFFATGLSYWPGPQYTLVAIPVREENIVEFAALTEAGELVFARWDRPSG
jgi:hypothetical protein